MVCIDEKKRIMHVCVCVSIPLSVCTRPRVFVNFLVCVCVCVFFWLCADRHTCGERTRDLLCLEIQKPLHREAVVVSVETLERRSCRPGSSLLAPPTRALGSPAFA